MINNTSYYCMQDIKAAMGKAQYNNFNAASLTLIHSHIQIIIVKHQRPQLTALNCSSQFIHPVLSSLTLPTVSSISKDLKFDRCTQFKSDLPTYCLYSACTIKTMDDRVLLSMWLIYITTCLIS